MELKTETEEALFFRLRTMSADLKIAYASIEKLHRIFETHKRYCRLTNVIWAAACVLIYIWF